MPEMETTNKADHTGRQKQNKNKNKKQQTNKETKKNRQKTISTLIREMKIKRRIMFLCLFEGSS